VADIKPRSSSASGHDPPAEHCVDPKWTDPGGGARSFLVKGSDHVAKLRLLLSGEGNAGPSASAVSLTRALIRPFRALRTG